jgi:predicted ATP-dependent endonuclease of OLD family
MSYRIDYVDYERLSISFLDKIETDSEENIFTVLIGKNGSGKSRVLSEIVNVLCSIYVDNTLLKRDIGTVSQYKQDDHNSSLSITSNKVHSKIQVHGRSIIKYKSINKDLVCPKKIIAASTSPFDKFPEEISYFSGRKESQVIYNYYGIEDRSKNKALLSLVQKLFFSVADNSLISNKPTIKKLLGFLGLESHFEINFRLKHGIGKFMSNLSAMSTNEFMNYISSAAQRDLSFLYKKYDINLKKLRDAFFTLNDYCIKHDFSRIITFEIFYDSLKVDSRTKKFISDIKILADIGILTVNDVIVNRKPSRDKDGWSWWREDSVRFSINDASSGQQCILLNVLGIAASIEDNSLILIDEPEISLHPEWQETYIQLLIDSFTHIKGCHFIVATHSPQIVSNLREENCFISLIETGHCISSQHFINKSADFQLATLFDAPGLGNEYLNRIAVNILTALSNGTFNLKDYSDDLELLKKNRSKIENEDNVRKLIDLALEITGRFFKC